MFVRHLGLLMVGGTEITRKELIKEAHKGGRAVAATGGSRRISELSGPAGVPIIGGARDLPALVDLPGLVIRVLGEGTDVVRRSAVVPFDVTDRGGGGARGRPGRAGS